MAKTKVLIKLQVSLASNDEDPPCLLYDEERSFVVHIPFTEDISNVMNGRKKAFFNATFEIKGNNYELIELGTEEPDPGW